MRKLHIFILMTILIGMAVSACSTDSTPKNPEETKMRERLKDEESRISESIKKETEKAIDSIKTATEKALLSGTQQTDSTIQKAIQQIQSSAEQEREKISEQLNEVNERVDKMDNKYLRILFGLSFLTLIVLALFLYIYLSNNNKQKKLKSSEPLNHELKQLIKEYVKNCINIPTSNERNANYTQKEIEHIVHNYCSDNDFEEFIRKITTEILHEKKYEALSNYQNAEQPPEYMTKPENIGTIGNQYILFTRASTTELLETTGKDYQIGKSLYKLILDNPDSSTATIDLCIDEKEAEERILARDPTYLGKICDLSRKTNSPKKVRVIDKGYAEKRDSNTWQVTKKIKVELE